jgi:sulfopyruvate decarboxylase subunit beta
MSRISDQVVELLEGKGIDLYISLPCDKLKTLLAALPADKQFTVTREACGVGLAAGAYLAGGRPLLVMQNTGFGNALTDLLSLSQSYRLPLPILASWRGDEEETIEAQKAFGAATDKLLEISGIPYSVISVPQDLEKIALMIDTAFEQNMPAVCLVRPNFWGEPAEIPLRARLTQWSPDDIHAFSPQRKVELTRYQAIEAIVSSIEEYDPEGLIVCNLGIPCKELFAVCEGKRAHAKNFYMLGSFGEVSAIGLGIALFSQKNIYSLDGDGSVLHNPNVLDAAVRTKASNFTLICLDNGVYSSTGNQMSPSNQMDLEQLARAYGFDATCTSKVFSREEIKNMIKSSSEAPRFFHAVLQSGNARVNNVPLSCTEIKDSFMNQLKKTT